MDASYWHSYFGFTESYFILFFTFIYTSNKSQRRKVYFRKSVFSIIIITKDENSKDQEYFCSKHKVFKAENQIILRKSWTLK